jgi:hypothetical protein
MRMCKCVSSCVWYKNEKDCRQASQCHLDEPLRLTYNGTMEHTHTLDLYKTRIIPPKRPGPGPCRPAHCMRSQSHSCVGKKASFGSHLGTHWPARFGVCVCVYVCVQRVLWIACTKCWCTFGSHSCTHWAARFGVCVCVFVCVQRGLWIARTKCWCTFGSHSCTRRRPVHFGECEWKNVCPLCEFVRTCTLAPHCVRELGATSYKLLSEHWGQCAERCHLQSIKRDPTFIY